MFVKKSRHLIEFAFILLIVCILSFLLTKTFDVAQNHIKIPHHIDELEFNPNFDPSSVNELDTDK